MPAAPEPPFRRAVIKEPEPPPHQNTEPLLPVQRTPERQYEYIPPVAPPVKKNVNGPADKKMLTPGEPERDKKILTFPTPDDDKKMLTPEPVNKNVNEVPADDEKMLTSPGRPTVQFEHEKEAGKVGRKRTELKTVSVLEAYHNGHTRSFDALSTQMQHYYRRERPYYFDDGPGSSDKRDAARNKAVGARADADKRANKRANTTRSA